MSITALSDAALAAAQAAPDIAVNEQIDHARKPLYVLLTPKAPAVRSPSRISATRAAYRGSRLRSMMRLIPATAEAPPAIPSSIHHVSLAEPLPPDTPVSGRRMPARAAPPAGAPPAGGGTTPDGGCVGSAAGTVAEPVGVGVGVRV